MLSWTPSQSFLLGMWQQGREERTFPAQIPGAALLLRLPGAFRPCLPWKAPGLAVPGAALATSSLLLLMRPRQETGKVQAGVKKAQGGSSCISLTSQPVQPCWGSGHHHQTLTVTLQGLSSCWTRPVLALLPGGTGGALTVPGSHVKINFQLDVEVSRMQTTVQRAKPLRSVLPVLPSLPMCVHGQVETPALLWPPLSAAGHGQHCPCQLLLLPCLTLAPSKSWVPPLLLLNQGLPVLPHAATPK